VATNGQTRGRQREGKTHHRKKPMALILCEKSTNLLTLSKDALKDEGTPWFIKCSGEENLSDMEHFNIIHDFILSKFFKRHANINSYTP
jgi:hypothetical protein